MSYMKRLAEAVREHDFAPTAGGYEHATSCRRCAKLPGEARREPLFVSADLHPEEIILCDQCGGPYEVCAGCQEDR